MKLTLDRAALLKALDPVRRVVERRNTIPILSNVLLRAEGARLTAKGTDLDCEITVGAPADVAHAGAVTAPAATLHEIARKLPDGATVAIEADAAQGTMTVKAGRSRFQLQTLPESDFPDLAAGEFSHRFDLDAKAFGRVLAHTTFAISTEETRYYLNGIFLHATDGADGPVMRAVSTDGHRLARVQWLAPEGSGGMPGIIVPRKAVDLLASLAKEAGDTALQVALSPVKIQVRAGETVLTSKLIDGTFPDYQRVIPTGNDKRLAVDTAPLVAALERVATIAGERGRAVRVDLTEARITLTVTNPDAGDATEELDADYEASPMTIGFNARYIIEILGVCGGDTTLVQLADPGSPTLFQSREGADALFVLMPMRV